MNFYKKNSEIYIPESSEESKENEALNKTTHMAIAAHQDDVEIMAYHGISECFSNNENWFFSVIVTNGENSPRNGIYKNYTNEEIKKIRIKEQKKAAFIGEYSGVALLNYESLEIKKSVNKSIESDLKKLLESATPKILYTHNLADKHDTHVAVSLKVIETLRSMPLKYHPKKIYGCEVWRNLDWLNDSDKVVFDTSKYPNISSALIEIFDSQICGSKKYDKATIGRRLANATYYNSFDVDNTDSMTYAMDLTPLIKKPHLNIAEYIKKYIEKFKDNVIDKIHQLQNK